MLNKIIRQNIILFTIVIILLIIAEFYIYDNKESISEKQVNLVAEKISRVFNENGLEGLRSIVPDSLNDRLSSIIISDNQGEIIWEYEGPGSGRHNGRSLITLTSPLIGNDSLFTKVSLHNPETVKSETGNFILKMLIYLIMGTGIILINILLLRKNISPYLSVLENHFGRQISDGNYEILDESISELKNNLFQEKKKMGEFSESLEKEIQKRTRDFEEANRLLKEEIRERKKAENANADIASMERVKSAELKKAYIELEMSRNAALNLTEDLSVEIKEREKTAKELEESEEKHRLLFENAGVGICYLNPEGKIILLNHAAAKIFGVELLDIINTSLTKILPFRQGERAGDIIDKTIKNRRRHTVEESLFVGKNKKNLLSIYNPVIDSEGEVIGTQVIYQDITELKEAEEKINKLNEFLEERVRDRTAQLESANRELESFSYSVSHDLRAPLRHINGFIEILQEKHISQLDEKGIRYLKIISDSATKMGVLIDELLDFSRTGRKELKKKALDPNKIIDTVRNELSGEIEGRDITWIIDDLPEIYADPNMLKLVFQNLIHNSLKYTRKKDVAIIQIGYQNSYKNEIEIFIKDNGVGFDMQYADKLFGIFQRLHRTDEFEGTGIGLANTKRIISRHNGRIWCEAELNKGATFYFTLPKIMVGDNEPED